LKQKYDDLLSNFTFNFSLHRYSGVKDRIGKMLARGLHPDTPEAEASQAGAYARPFSAQRKHYLWATRVYFSA
jgi:hypothetical protein